jgi:hypothetical protein
MSNCTPHRAVADTVGRFDGFVAKYMGDMQDQVCMTRRWRG